MRQTFLIALLWIVAPSLHAEDTRPAEVTATAKQYKALLAEVEEEGGTRKFTKRFLKLADQQPQDPAAADALLWVVAKVPGKPDTKRALDMLRKHHIKSDKLGPACQYIAGSRSTGAETLLRAILEENPHKQVRAQACYYLASLLDLEVSLVEKLKAQPEIVPRVLQYYGEEYGKHLTSLQPAVLEKQREQVYERILKSFADVEMSGTTMGRIAKSTLFRLRNLAIGKVAPEIEGQDIHGQKFKLSDYRGKVVMLTFWGHW